ncbi:MAG: hypothetical protein ACTHNY_05250 [Solirubrobacterales bacterium]
MPSIEYSTPDPIRNNEATLHFAIDPGGLDTEYEVEIAQVGESFQDWGMPDLVAAGDEPVALEVQLPRYWEGALSEGREYHWRVRAWNTAGETVGSDQLFTTTDGPAPVFTNLTATQTGPATVTFTGTVDPEGATLTGCRFRWVSPGTFENAGFEKWAATEIVRFGETVPCEESPTEIGSGTEPVSVHAEATIESGEWFFRLEGENAFVDAVATGGVPFTVAPGFGSEEPPTEPPVQGGGGPPFQPPGPPPAEVPPVQKKACPRTHRGKAKGARSHGKKKGHGRRHAKHGRGKACGRRA